MKRAIVISMLIIGLTAGYSFAQMGQGHMMGQGQGMMGSQNPEQTGETPYGYGGGYFPCQMMGGMMGQGMMGPGMMGGYGMGPGMMGGYGMGPGMMGGMMGPGMMRHMGGYGMMGPGMMGHMGGYGMGPGMMGYGYGGKYDPEAYEKYQKDYQKYLDDTADLRKKLHNKKFEYFEALRDPDTKSDAIMKMEKEMRDLQWELYEKAPR